MSLQVELLEQSFNYIKPYEELFVSNFYENLFKVNPELKSLFTNLDSETKENQLGHDLVLVMENLRQPEILKNILEGLGARLFTYGVLPQHYPLMKNAFFSSFEQFLGSKWTTELTQAWDDAYVTFRDLMLDGAEKTRRQMGYTNSVTESVEEPIEEVVNHDNSVVEELLETPVAGLEENITEGVEVIANKDDAVVEDILEVPAAQLEENMTKVPTVANTNNSVTEEILETSLSKSATMVEEQVIIVEDTEPSREKTTFKTTMSESDKNIPQNDTINNHDEVPLTETTVDNSLEDLSAKLKSETIDPHFTQIFIPESQPESATTSGATATAVKSVASEKDYQPEIKTGQSNKGLLIGGGVAGAIGLLLLLLL